MSKWVLSIILSFALVLNGNAFQVTVPKQARTGRITTTLTSLNLFQTRRFMQHLSTPDSKTTTHGLGLRLRNVAKHVRKFVSQTTTKKETNNDNTVSSSTAPLEMEQENKATNELAVLSLENQAIERSHVAANATDLSGVWKPITNPTFLQQYDEYLENCSQSFMFRKVVVNALGLTKDEVIQDREGRSLTIVGTNPAGKWSRTLSTEEICTVVDPDHERVQIESYWLGSKHVSILRGKKRLDGGEFETIRYLGGDHLICESYFHPNLNSKKNKNFHPGFVKWTYERIEPTVNQGSLAP
mmetsp:Transcript_17948/g.27178  ORF Transcript_17948/g.27178 Transcript_17948/m.27178 type:complete len:299 (-) Transcript_17948:278-1174(-)|eukprot:CAMPEP_0178924320 /NCGR_PEP_ID=MMETSP0786-20121207/17259_1 /TAXON_ID=186022 /ORGANISM="Thalassionema frauenfeldii, Strain CCMP 1798" /LENGTH=298 /DNA_ID=CAMNT_0020599013 /DNA_START=108 /DNA_END=1004 /DNA_ORIENTATION=-